MDWIKPKTDWTIKSYVNKEDFDRIESNTKFIADFLNSIYYTIRLEPIKTGRNMLEYESLNDINRIEKNIETIRLNFTTPPGCLPRKVWRVRRGFDYADMNRLERNLESLHYWATTKARDNQIFAGTFSCGAEWEGGLY